MKERITSEDKQHLIKMLSLNNPNLVKIWKIDDLDSHSPVVEMVSRSCPFVADLRECLKSLCPHKNSKSITNGEDLLHL